MATRKARRIQMLAFGAVLLAGSAALVSYAFRDTIAFFKTPTEIMAENPPPGRRLRLGGLVAAGSLERAAGKTVTFEVSDGSGGTIEVAYSGILPDLFREGQGVVAEGYWRDGRFVAVEVLAKHDENYVPKEVADALKEQGHWQPSGPGTSGSGS